MMDEPSESRAYRPWQYLYHVISWLVASTQVHADHCLLLSGPNADSREAKHGGRPCDVGAPQIDVFLVREMRGYPARPSQREERWDESKVHRRQSK